MKAVFSTVACLFLLLAHVNSDASASQIRDPYSVLGLNSSASDMEVEASLHRLMLRYHPSRYTAPDSEDVRKQIRSAYQIISDSRKGQASIAQSSNVLSFLNDLNKQLHEGNFDQAVAMVSELKSVPSGVLRAKGEPSVWAAFSAVIRQVTQDHWAPNLELLKSLVVVQGGRSEFEANSRKWLIAEMLIFTTVQSAEVLNSRDFSNYLNDLAAFIEQSRGSFDNSVTGQAESRRYGLSLSNVYVLAEHAAKHGIINNLESFVEFTNQYALDPIVRSRQSRYFDRLQLTDGKLDLLERLARTASASTLSKLLARLSSDEAALKLFRAWSESDSRPPARADEILEILSALRFKRPLVASLREVQFDNYEQNKLDFLDFKFADDFRLVLSNQKKENAVQLEKISRKLVPEFHRTVRGPDDIKLFKELSRLTLGEYTAARVISAGFGARRKAIADHFNGEIDATVRCEFIF